MLGESTDCDVNVLKTLSILSGSVLLALGISMTRKMR